MSILRNIKKLKNQKSLLTLEQALIPYEETLDAKWGVNPTFNTVLDQQVYYTEKSRTIVSAFRDVKRDIDRFYDEQNEIYLAILFESVLIALGIAFTAWLVFFIVSYTT